MMKEKIPVFIKTIYLFANIIILVLILNVCSTLGIFNDIYNSHRIDMNFIYRITILAFRPNGSIYVALSLIAFFFIVINILYVKKKISHNVIITMLIIINNIVYLYFSFTMLIFLLMFDEVFFMPPQ